MEYRLRLFALVAAASLSACGGGGGGGGAETEIERAPADFEVCQVRLSDTGTCPVSQIKHKVPHLGELLK